MESLLTLFDYIIFGFMLVFSAGIGIYYRFSGGKQKTNKEYFLADKNMPVIPVAFSLMASFMSAVTLLGVASENYMYGTQFTVINISYIIGTPIAAFVFLPVFFQMQATSSFEYLEKRFSRTVRLLASAIFIFQMMLYMAIVLYAPALTLSAITGIPKWTSVVSIGIVCTFYCTIGGIKAVLWTDLFQSLLMFSAVFAVVAKGTIDVGGFNKVWELATKGERIQFLNFDPDPTVRHTVWNLIIGGLFTYTSIYAVNQAQVQRLLTVKSLKRSQMLSLVFLEDKIPDGMAHIGNSVFVYPSTFKGTVEVHIRRFTKYGKKFYPSKEGITINPEWIDLIMYKTVLPKTIEDITNLSKVTRKQITFDTSDFENFTLTSFKTSQNGKIFSKSITISSQQWTEMTNQHILITEATLDNIYSSMDFFNAYKIYDERHIDEQLPDSLDVSVGTHYLSEILRDSVCDCLKDNGGLKDAELMAEELWAHRVETVNSVALTLDVNEIANKFYYRIWECKDKLLLLKPAMYITVNFLKDVRLQDVLREVRSILCPPDTFEYYECLE